MARPRKATAGQSAAKKPHTSAAPTDAERVDAASPPTEPEPKPIGDASPRKPGRPSNADKLREQLGQTITMIGVGVGTVAGMSDGIVIVQNAPDLADALVRLGEANPRVMRLLQSGMTNSAWAGVIFVTARIGLQIANNHGAQIPTFLIGAPSAPPADMSSNGTAQ